MEYINVAYIILNYNDNKDLFKMLPLLENQTAEARFIIVDNKSAEENLTELEEWVSSKDNSFIADKQLFYDGNFESDKKYYLVRNDWDAGFSGGNNVGFRVAHKLGIKYALLVSPDVLIEDNNYLKVLLSEMKAYPEVVVAGSDILGLDGEPQSPHKMPSFWNEIFWFWFRFFPPKDTINRNTHIIKNETIHGCCMLFDVDFLDNIDYLDENVFMYSEEPILTRRVQRKGKEILFVNSVTAVHAHDRQKKSNSSKRMLTFLKSRQYYIWEYSQYNLIQKALISLSYKFCNLLHYVKYKTSK